MAWLYRLQQRIAITRAEGFALMVVGGLLVAGMAILYVQQNTAVPDEGAYEETDRQLAEARNSLNSPSRTRRSERTRHSAGVTRLPVPHNMYLPAKRKNRPAPEEEKVSEPIDRPEPTPVAALPPVQQRINLNTASASELEGLPGIGPTLAQRILLYREQNGAFERVEDIQQISGIGPKTFDRIQPLIATAASPPEAQ